MASHIVVKNFERLQHYKDRNPTWIKLYNEILDDYEFGCLPDASKWLAVGIWLLASRYENRIPNDPRWIGNKINATEPVDLAALVSAGFITVVQDASNPLAGRSGPAMPEREGEGEEEKRTTVGCLTREGEDDDSGAPPPDPPAADAEPAPAPAPAAPTAEDVLELVTTANVAMRQNPAIDQHRLTPIEPGHAASVNAIGEWMRDGISLDTAAEVIQRLAQEYRPSGRSKQISSLVYFDGAVRDAHALATGAPRPKRGGARGNGGIPRRSPRPDEYVPTTTVATWG